ncbi:DUF1612 domain-containing protein [Agrobacterium vitis]|uniref:DUF1612 domain-containing protein n=1 Tax=Agrobacterium vitis TaxID=373 RepID=A0A6L6VKH9_AGRVI|nr:RHE_PE00001 family protein [Agrobacterium vitis]MUZ74779.1 DUF1612 domain-containing protein [Agrobacterium vitis]
MVYEIGALPLQDLLPAIGRAEDRLARLDEAVRRSPAGAGFIERGHFVDATANMWILGELVHIEDLVLHDAHMGIRAPTHELTIAHAILRSRRRIVDADPNWAISMSGIISLAGLMSDENGGSLGQKTDRVGEGAWGVENVGTDSLAEDFAAIDALLDRSQRLLDQVTPKATTAASSKRASLMVGDLVIRDADWDEQERLLRWRHVIKDVEYFPAALAAALLYDAWSAIDPMQRQVWLGGQLASAYLRSRGKVTSHLPAFNVGLKAISRDRRRAPARPTRLIAFLDAMSAAADAGMKEVARLSLAREQMERTLRDRRSTSNLPAVIELVLSHPMVSTPMIAKAAGVTNRSALNLIAELRVREMTGRGRYRAWGVV